MLLTYTGRTEGTYVITMQAAILDLDLGKVSDSLSGVALGIKRNSKDVTDIK